MAWQIDPAHSQIEFSVRHMMISNVRGRFENFSGTIEFDPERVEDSRADIHIDAASINTREPQRDTHLRSADFLDVENYPEITFKSTRSEKTSRDEFKLYGDLTIRGTARPVELKATYSGLQKSPWGTTSAGFEIEGKVNRKDWGLVWNQTLETGGILVGDDVKISIELELVQVVEQAAEAA